MCSAAAQAWRADVGRFVRSVGRRRRDTKQFSGVAEMGFAGGPGEQVVMADAVERKSYRNRKSCTIDQSAPADFSGLFDVPR